MTSPPPPTTPADDKVLERFLEKRRVRREKGETYRTYLKWSGKALEAPLSVVVGLGLGILLERKLGIAPWGTWGGLFFGTAAGVRALYRIVKQYQRENPDDDPREAR
jgi:F0F1-type ATP synthase assembly protein I